MSVQNSGSYSDEKFEQMVRSLGDVNRTHSENVLLRVIDGLRSRNEDLGHYANSKDELIAAALVVHYNDSGFCATCTAAGWGEMEPSPWPCETADALGVTE